MTQKELIGKIKAEIERRIEIAEHRIDNNRELENPESVDMEQLIKWNAKRDLQICHQDGKAEALKDILFFIESLEQSIDADKMIGLDEAAEEYAYNNWEDNDYHTGASEGLPFDAIGHTANCFKAGAKWIAEQGETMEVTDDTKWADVDKFVHRTLVAENGKGADIIQIRKK